PGLAEALHEEEKRLDAWRLLLVDFTHETANLFRAGKSGANADVRTAVNRMMELVSKLAKLPGHDERIIIRYRGRVVPSSGRASARYDYHILYGSLDLDIPGVHVAARRLGVTASRLPGKITSAFEALATAKVVSIQVRTGEWEISDREALRTSLDYLADYIQVEADLAEPESFAKEGRFPVSVLFDESGRADANLSLLAAQNKLKPETARGLTQKISGMLVCECSDPMELFTGTFDAIFGFKKLKEQLTRPAVELNNPRWVISATDKEAIGRDKLRMARFLSMRLGNESFDTVRMLEALYAADYGQVNAQDIQDRMAVATVLVNAVQKAAKTTGHMKDMAAWASAMSEDILAAVKNRLELVPEEAFDDLIISGELMKALTEDEKVLEKKIHREILDLVSFYKQRSITKRKVKGMVRRPTEFDLQDYEVMARDFSILPDDARHMVELLRGCFNARGHFLRPAFEKSIPEFARYEEKVFEFLWHHLKEIMDRQDRIAFLNAIQLLIDQIRQRQSSLAVLLNDFKRDPETATWSDRNALMLGNLLLRKYSKELHTDIEITPEEVLLVVEGLDPAMVEFARNRVDAAKEDFFLKVRTIHRKLKDSLDPYPGTDVMPARYVFTLEREIYILLALVGGQVARAVLRSAAKEYGNPESEIYWMKKSDEQMPGLLQIFQVVARGLGRIGQTSDLVFLKELLGKEGDFFAINKASHHRDQVRRVMRWVDTAQRSIMESQFSKAGG
ncbi:MAG: hypothetical protein KKA60_07915, partial [Proteobacteria bacterium]|nr:hypothetical protein [Pseudomonadota bacterium]